jgi:GTP-binding protein HflX
MKELDMEDVPVLVVYNKSDQLKEEFVPTLFPNVVISAKSNVGREMLTTAIKQRMMEIMEPYFVEIPASDGRKLSSYKQHSLVVEQEFDEENEIYQLRGFARKNSRYLPQAVEDKEDWEL